MNIILPIFFGLLAASASLVLEATASLLPYFQLPVPGSPLTLEGISYLILFASIEESAKLMMVMKYFGQNKKPSAGVRQAVLIGLGFSILESFFHLMSLENKAAFFDLRYMAPIFMHLLTTYIMAHLLVRNIGRKRFVILKALSIAFAVHIFYNLSLFLF